MISYEVNGMSCGHCIGAITGTIQAADTNTRVNVDLASRTVSVEGSVITPQQIETAIREAGYEVIRRVT